MSADHVGTLPVGHFYSFFCQFLTANVSTVGGGGLLLLLFLWATWRPLVVRCGMTAMLQDPTVLTKCRLLLLSG